MATMVTVKNVREMRAKVASARRGLSKFKTPYKRSAIFLDRWVQNNFKTEGGNVGGWAPFKRGGRMGKKGRLDTSAKLLQDSGHLRVSFIPWATDRNAGIGSELDYAENHNEGIGVTQRRILPTRKEIRGDIKKIFNQYAKEQLKKAFGV